MAAILERKTFKGHMITPWGEECWVKLSKIDKIVILCYYV